MTDLSPQAFAGCMDVVTFLLLLPMCPLAACRASFIGAPGDDAHSCHETVEYGKGRSIEVSRLCQGLRANSHKAEAYNVDRLVNLLWAWCSTMRICSSLGCHLLVPWQYS